jgi:hypothetical protein
MLGYLHENLRIYSKREFVVENWWIGPETEKRIINEINK